MQIFVQFVLSYIQNLNYLSVFGLMTLESSFIPFPSEAIVPPAAYLAQQGQLNIFLVIVAGIAGSLMGAIINYFLAFYLGRVLVYKLADYKIFKVILINSAKVERSEKFFLRYGGISTFLGRLVPVVRQLISLPAGFSRMNFFKFIFYTFLGSGIWVIILAMLGFYLGAREELLLEYFKEISLLMVMLVLVVFLFLYLRRRGKFKSQSLENEDS